MAEDASEVRGARCTVLFSGGSDSTLVAAMALERFEAVDLLTCQRKLMFFVENTRGSAGTFEERYGPERVDYVLVDINDAFGRIYLADFRSDLRRYQTHLTLLVCLACKMSMHAAAIVHNLRTGNGHTLDGARRETEWYPAQMASVKEQMRQLHAEFGLTLESPVYDTIKTDERIHEMGLVGQKTLKGQFLIHDTQPSCVFGSVAHVYTRLFYGPFFGQDVREQDSLDYFHRKRPALVDWIKAQLSEAAG